ncbi:hypothetical protein CH063_11759 [Colletotrichum higginsianum]|uniref:Uncharacterized protein n=2 Tax=Colletotrichum higginsianum TaxID=80884 RepID=H1VMQ2_COLHI|nr:hypothetical protein CH063_11759 [Colletotrichum higginsianum]
MLTQELPRLGLPGSHHLTVSMEEVMAHPTMAEQFELAARKMRDARRRTIVEVFSSSTTSSSSSSSSSSRTHPSWGRRGLKMLVSGGGSTSTSTSASVNASSSSSVDVYRGPSAQQQQQQGGAPFMDSIAEGAISGGIRAARPASPVELDGPRRQRLSLAVEHDGSSMESLTTGSSRTDEETEDRRPSVPGNGEDREEEDADVVSPLSATTTTAPTPVKESRIRRKAGSVLSRISLVSPVSLSGSKLGHR